MKTLEPKNPTPSRIPVSDYFEGDRLELTWRYAYRPEFIPLLLDYLGAQSGMSILDAGCGSGFLSRLLARTVADVQVIGLDADAKMLSLARQLLAREGLSQQVELHHGNVYQLPFADDTFDLTTSQTLL